MCWVDDEELGELEVLGEPQAAARSASEATMAKRLTLLADLIAIPPEFARPASVGIRVT